MDRKHRTHHSRSIPRNRFLSSLLYASLLFRSVITVGPSACFFLDGTSAAGHRPCIPAEDRNSDEHSSCCVLGDPVSNSNDDICTREGLCLYQGANDSRAMFFQGPCTDSSHADRSCRTYCPPKTSGTVYPSQTACPVTFLHK